MQRPQSSVVLLLIIMAIILAIASFLALSFVRRRPAAPAGTRTVVVEGVEVTLRTDPAKVVQMIGPLPQPAGQEVVVPTAEPQTQPAQQEQPTAQIVVESTLVPTPVPPAPTPVPDSVIFVDYAVQQNDTLYSISRRIDTSIALMARYGISQDDLVPGTVIRLPIGNPAYCPGYRPYAVGEGDTVFNLGKRFNTTPAQLRAINNLGDDFIIYIATIICVP